MFQSHSVFQSVLGLTMIWPQVSIGTNTARHSLFPLPSGRQHILSCESYSKCRWVNFQMWRLLVGLKPVNKEGEVLWLAPVLAVLGEDPERTVHLLQLPFNSSMKGGSRATKGLPKLFVFLHGSGWSYLRLLFRKDTYIFLVSFTGTGLIVCY